MNDSKNWLGSNLSTNSLRICQNLDFNESLVDSFEICWNSDGNIFYRFLKIIGDEIVRSILFIQRERTFDKISLFLYSSVIRGLVKNSKSFAVILSFNLLPTLEAKYCSGVPNTTALNQRFLYLLYC